MSFNPAFGASVINTNNSLFAASQEQHRRTRASRDRSTPEGQPEQENRWRPRLAHKEIDEPIPEGHLIGYIDNSSTYESKAVMHTIHGDDVGRAAKEKWTAATAVVDRLNGSQFRAVPNSARSMLGGPT